jgi:photosystem II stability/assembly factor-like uncharacterized protein
MRSMKRFRPIPRSRRSEHRAAQQAREPGASKRCDRLELQRAQVMRGALGRDQVTRSSSREGATSCTVTRATTVACALAALALCGCGATATTAPSSSVAARPGVHVWALDATGAVTSTADGGATWTTRSEAASSEIFRAIAFPDARHGWVVATSGTIDSTADGGATWHSQVSGTNAMLRDVSFADASHGCAVGVGGTILTTVDGGRNWVARDTNKSADLRAVASLDAAHIVAVGAGVIYASNDGGQRWRVVYRAKAADFFDVAAPDRKHCWVVGEDGAKLTGLVLASNDGGMHWVTQYAPPFDPNAVHPFLLSVAFADASHGWVVGLNNTILGTSDGGTTWSDQSTGSQGRYFAVACTGPRDAWLIGSQGHKSVAWSTTDGGSVWTPSYKRHESAYMDVTCLATGSLSK